MTLTPHFLPVGSIVEYNILIHNRWMPVRLNATDILQCETDNKHFNTFHRPLKLTPEILTEWCGFEKRDDTYQLLGFSINSDFKYCMIDDYGYPIYEGYCEPMLYLHQLQHLYSALTQTVLPITIK